MSIQVIEQKALRIFEINRQIALFEEEKDLIKKTIANEMKKEGMTDYLFRLNEVSDLKVVVGDRITKKLDKEELAADLDISLEAAGKKDVLIKKTEEGKLTHSQFKQYEYNETTETVAVRKVNA